MDFLLSMEKYYEKINLNAYSLCTIFITRNCNQYGQFYKQQGGKDEHANNQLWKKWRLRQNIEFYGLNFAINFGIVLYLTINGQKVVGN